MMKLQMQLPVSGLVICFNESRLLPRCLNALSFCEEIVVCDLGSTDTSMAVAKQYGARVVSLPWVPIVEMTRSLATEQCKHDWIAMVDPDEVIEEGAIEQIKKGITTNPIAAKLVFPWVFYFKNQILTSTRWGFKAKIKPIAIHRRRINFGKNVHAACTVLDGFEEVRFPANGNNALRHYWCDSWTQLWEKHLRYIKGEGQARYEMGERYSFSAIAIQPIKEFWSNYRYMAGWRDGWRGLLLSLFRAWYVLACGMSLRSFQKKIKPQ